MKRHLIILALLGTIPFLGFAQKYKADKSNVHFYSSAPVEDIEATNTAAQSVFDAESGQIVFSIPIDQFQFEKSLMQEHFNENYLESDEYPNSTFQAQIKDWKKGSSGKMDVTVEGELLIHGVTQKKTVEGTLSVEGDKATVDAVFWVELKDHKVKIPKAVFYNIAEKVKVTVHFDYQLIK